jgi:hypothetical protein
MRGYIDMKTNMWIDKADADLILEFCFTKSNFL